MERWEEKLGVVCGSGDTAASERPGSQLIDGMGGGDGMYGWMVGRGRTGFWSLRQRSLHGPRGVCTKVIGRRQLIRQQRWAGEAQIVHNCRARWS